MKIGTIVLSKAGRDKGRLLLVVDASEENFRLVADGKTRPLAKPKRKKLRHLAQAGYSRELAEQLEQRTLTDKLLKQKLKLLEQKAE